MPRPGPSARVVCLPHAGGSAGFYAAWAADLPARYELSAVQYPGREDRIGEPPPSRLDSLVDQVHDAVLPLTDRPVVLFGHSFGAVVGYEVARRLTASGAPPEHLVVSGRNAPCVPPTGDIHRRDDDGLVDELLRLGGTSAELLRDPSFRAVYLPAVRADFRLAETYRHAAPGPGARSLGCPVTAVTGASDTEADEAGVGRWGLHTSGPFTQHTVPGGHFYFVPDRTPVVDLLAPVADRREARSTRRAVPAESGTSA